MKVAMLCDTHWGLNKGNPEFLSNIDLFLGNVFFPTLSERKISNIIHLGDLVHDRKRIDFRVLSHMKESFLDILRDSNIHMNIIVGNHDIPLRDVIVSDACTELLYGYENITVHTQVTEIPQWNMIMIPWLTKTNREETLQAILQSKMRFALGHLELNGFNFSKTQVALHGDDPKNFSRFEKVFSGHYHYPHSKDNITYLGSPNEQTWIDVNTTRGFYIFDSETGDMEFIQNPYNIFENVKFGDNSYRERTHPRYYRLYINGDEKQSDVENFIKELIDFDAIRVDVVGHRKSVVELTTSNRNTEENYDVNEDTVTFIRRFVKDEAVANILVDLYNRTMAENSI